MRIFNKNFIYDLQQIVSESLDPPTALKALPQNRSFFFVASLLLNPFAMRR